MLRFRNAVLTGGLLSLLALAGCGGGYYVGASYGPPAPIYEQPYGVAPGPGYIWTPGYYDWYGGRWTWRHGEWRRRPHREDRWVAPRWERHGNHYRYHQGEWRHGNHYHH